MRALIIAGVAVVVLWLIGAACIGMWTNGLRDQVAAAQVQAEDATAATKRCEAALRKSELAGADAAGRLGELHFWLDRGRASTTVNAGTGVVR
jgi:hypothetical protein